MATNGAGRLALITGAAHGIGRSVALAMADAGYRLLLFDIDQEPLEATVAEIARRGGMAEWRRVNCIEADEVNLEISAWEIEILINVVGEGPRSHSCRFDLSTPAQWSRILAVSLTTAMNCSHAVVAGMCERGWGRIINFASDAALRPTIFLSEYAAAKAGVIGFTRGLATEASPHGVTVNAIAPGLIMTRALDNQPEEVIGRAAAETLIGRTGRPEEVAHAVLFLAHDQASFITGQTIAVNGGRSFI